LEVIPFLEAVHPELAQVECLLQEVLARAAAPLGPGLGQVLAGGKRLRPALVILAGRALDGGGPPFQLLAAALDLVHAATLIHDDIIDGAALRRGRAALHTLWPPAAAVLAGDYLLGEAIALLAELDRPCLTRAFAELLRAACAGEIAEILGDASADPRTAYERRCEAKTAALFAMGLEMAGLLAAAAEPQLAALRRYGREFGLAYQIVDDVLDLTVGEDELGKPAAADLRQGLATLPILCYLERATAAEDPVRAVLAGRRDPERVEAAVQAIRTSGAIEAALDEARAHVQQAQVALMGLPESKARRMLGELAVYVVQRRR